MEIAGWVMSAWVFPSTLTVMRKFLFTLVLFTRSVKSEGGLGLGQSVAPFLISPSIPGDLSPVDRT